MLEISKLVHKINFIDSLTTDQQNTLTEAGFPLPHTIPDLEVKVLDGKQVSRAQDLKKRLNEVLEHNKKEGSPKSRFNRLLKTLCVAAVITCIVLSGIFLPLAASLQFALYYFVGSQLYTPPWKINPCLKMLTAPLLLLVGPLFGKYKDTSSIEKECDDLLENFEYLKKKKTIILENLEAQIEALKEEQKYLPEIGKKHILDLDNKSDIDKSVIATEENLIIVNAMKKCKNESTDLIRNLETFLKKFKQIDAASESAPAQV